MISRAALLGWATVCLIVFAGSAGAQDLQRQKSAVVKLTAQSDGKIRTGTGFIVKIEPDAVYIATAFHVVEGDPAPLVGTLVDNADNASIRAKVFDLRTNQQIGSYELPVVPDLSLAPAVVIFMVTFNIPGDSTTPQPHMHISYLHFRIQSDNSAVLVQNCDQTGGCYPAQGRVALE